MQEQAPRDTASKAADLHSLLRCALVAEENEASGLDWKGLDRVLDMAERLAYEIMNEVESVKGAEN
ncbi:hypothetical protein [Roseovarius atlanticus]|uniref:hypothetical protein n=1 Tax=Roseovarius atlanticus TaxID=1641875 RepID=UPI001C97FE90|nr:hypothetical protein [Roseovarius atlanticus]MBY5987078.1 hypothetical protein [Roseovarius atlanticus]MBY6125718.1 hypothetical protein [Roseovarius atlanticus]MBY6149821.1 hypothetical protein [Roseovarius atlanticus]